MNQKMQKGLLILTIGLTFLGYQGFAEPMEDPHADSIFEMVLDFVDGEKQRQAIRAAGVEFDKRVADVEGELDIAELELERLQFERDADLPTLRKQVKLINSLRLKLDLETIDAFAKARSLLTPEQWGLFKQENSRQPELEEPSEEKMGRE